MTFRIVIFHGVEVAVKIKQATFVSTVYETVTLHCDIFKLGLYGLLQSSCVLNPDPWKPNWKKLT